MSVRPPDEDRIAFRAATRARQEAFNRDIPDIQEIPMLMDAFHEDEFWEELGRAAAFPATPAPTFAPPATASISATRWIRARPRGAASACGTPAPRRSSPWSPAVTTSGPRRPPACGHRMYHKLNGFLAKHDRNLCVGCGPLRFRLQS